MNNAESLKDIIENYSEELKYLSSSEIENLQALLEDIKNRPKSIWDLDIDNGQEYYCLFNDGQIDRLSFLGGYDKNVRAWGNAFLTEEEAEFERERRKIEAIMRKYSRPFKEGEGNCCIYYDYDYNDIEVGTHYITNYRIPYFESGKVILKVIDEIGEDRLIKYWFGVNSQDKDKQESR